MGKLLERCASGPLWWLDYTDYGISLLASGRAPWLDTSEAIAWYRKANSLLRSDVVALPIDGICSAWLGTRSDLRAVMTAKRRRIGAPMRVLLEDEALRVHLVDFALALRSAFPDRLVAIECSSPGQWAVWAARAAGLEEPLAIDDELVDSAAAYQADFLRVFAQCGIDLLLLGQCVPGTDPPREDSALWQPLHNLATHYRWDIGARMPACTASELPRNLTFVLASTAIEGVLTGMQVPAACWAGEALPAARPDTFRHAQIPVDARPEAVLACLQAWR